MDYYKKIAGAQFNFSKLVNYEIKDDEINLIEAKSVEQLKILNDVLSCNINDFHV